MREFAASCMVPFLNAWRWVAVLWIWISYPGITLDEAEEIYESRE